MNRTFIGAAALVVVAGASMFATQKAFAQSPDTVSNSSPMTSLVQKVSAKFGLKTEDVQAVFDQDRQERQVQHQAQETARLDQLVTDGKLTSAQKQLIVAKREELKSKLKANMESLKDKTPEERKGAIDAERKSLEEWAKQNNIDAQYIMPRGPGIRRAGHKGFGPGEMKPIEGNTAATPAQ